MLRYSSTPYSVDTSQWSEGNRIRTELRSMVSVSAGGESSPGSKVFQGSSVDYSCRLQTVEARRQGYKPLNKSNPSPYVPVSICILRTPSSLHTQRHTTQCPTSRLRTSYCICTFHVSQRSPRLILLETIALPLPPLSYSSSPSFSPPPPDLA